MPKSKYPNKLDTSIEIPAVRDNIVEVGSDVLNSIRSALFQIEKTLGINPQGATGNTVSDRLNKALDGNGNILKEALDRSNVLSGPITDVDVSKTAAINESKLRLNYPTQLLQDELSMLVNEVDSLLVTIEELSVLFNAHVHASATNRHFGQAITIQAIDSTTSSEGIISVEATDSQAAFESIFQSHINYDGSDISLTNRSHEANQLFFDNTDSTSYIDSNDVQGAIEETLSHATSQMADHQNKQHSNSVDRYATILSPSEFDEGILILDDESIQYSATPTLSTDEAVIITFSDSPDAPSARIGKSDILKITDDSGSTEYQINKAIYSGAGDATLAQVEIFARFAEDSDASAVGKIYRNLNAEANFGGLLVSVREYESGETDSDGIEISNSDIIQISNPDSATIITRGVRPSEITASSTSNRYFAISVDGGTAVSVDVYDGTASVQTIDTILKKLNESFAGNGLSVHAYRVDYDEGKASEIALVHSIPSTSEISYTLSVSRGSDDAIDSLGLSDFEDLTIDSGPGTAYYIQGQAHNGLDTKLSETGLSFLIGTSSVTSESIDFIEKGICAGDLLIITGSNADDGTYVILNVDTGQLTLDSNQMSEGEWSDVASDDTGFYIYKNSMSLNGLEFDATPAGDTVAYIVDVSMDYNRNAFYNVRLAYGTLNGVSSSNVIAITDFEGDISAYTEDSPGSLSLEKSIDDNPLLSLDGGPQLELGAISNAYIQLESGTHDITLTLFVQDVTDITTGLSEFAEADYAGDAIEIQGFEGINEEENLLLSRVSYDAATARVIGAGSEIPRIFSKLRRGGVGQSNLGTDAIYSSQQRPIKETRSNGVVSGLDVTVADPAINGNSHYMISLASGVCYVKGKRFELDARVDLATGIAEPAGSSPTTDKLFVAIDQWGSVVFASAGADGSGAECASPFDPYNYCVLCTVEYDSVNTPVATDLRLFIDQLDFKLLNSITVSPQRGMGHFDNIGDAIKYAKRFSEAYTKAGTPTIHLKAGVHKVILDMGDTFGSGLASDYYQAASDYGLWINFPVNIVGEGNSTILDIQRVGSGDGEGEADDDRTESGEPDHKGYLPIAGPGFTSTPDYNSDVIEGGFVNLSNFRMRLCSIWVLDPTVYTEGSSGDSINWGVNIDNVIFDQTEKTDFGATNLGVCLRSADSNDSTDYIGNVKISNCQFLNSHIKTVDWLATLHKNISILHNVFSGDGAGNPAPESHYGLYIGGTGHLSGFDTDDPPHENNIRIVGNVYTDDNGAAKIDPSGLHLWGDRVGRLGVSDLTVDGSISATMTDLLVSRNSTDIEPQIIIHEESTDDGARINFTNTADIAGPTGNSSHEWTLYGKSAIEGSPEEALFNIWYGDAHPSVGGRNIISVNGAGKIGFNTQSPDEMLHILGYDDAGDGAACKVKLESLTGTDIGIVGFHDDDYTVEADDDTVEGDGIPDGLEDDSTQVFSVGYSSEYDVVSLSYGELSNCHLVINSDGHVMITDYDDVDVDSLGGDTLDHQLQIKTSSTPRFGLHYEPDSGSISNGSKLGVINFGGRDDTYADQGLVRAAIKSSATETWASGASGADLQFFTTETGTASMTEKMTLDGNGFLGIGDSTPNYPLHVKVAHDADYVACFDNTGGGVEDDGIRISIGPGDSGVLGVNNFFVTFCNGDDSVQGYIRSDGAGGIYLHPAQAFTGSHPTVMQAEDFVLGLIVESTGELWANNIEHVSSAIPKVRLSSSNNSKTVFGVIAEKDSHPGYQKTYGIFEGEAQVCINGLGEGKVWVTDKDGNIENGDYITTSVVPGYGMLQSDDILRNYTVAKCTEAVDWSQVTETIDHDGLTYKKYLIACTYHCS